MAGEYSRELSVKVFAGLAKLARLGFRTGGIPGYGYRRMLVSPDRTPKQELKDGQKKNIHEDRVILVPGPEQEVACIREIFRLFIEEQMDANQIARELNQRRIPYPGVKRSKWYGGAVYRILRSPKYAGWLLFGRSAERLQTPRVPVAENLWIKTPNAWTPIVSQKVFDKAQKRYLSYTRHKSDQQLLDELRKLVARKGSHCYKHLRLSKGLSSCGAYTQRFGTLTDALLRIGAPAPVAAMNARRGTRRLRDQLLKSTLACCEGTAIVQEPNKHFRPKLRLADGTLVSVYVCRFRIVPKHREPRWTIQPKGVDAEHPGLLARLTANNDSFQDFFVVRNLEGFGAKNLRLRDEWLLKALRLESLSDLPLLVQRMHAEAREAKSKPYHLRGWPEISSFLGVSLSTAHRRALNGMPIKREGYHAVADRTELEQWRGRVYRRK